MLDKKELWSLLLLLIECKNNKTLQNIADLSYLECINLSQKLNNLIKEANKAEVKNG